MLQSSFGWYLFYACTLHVIFGEMENNWDKSKESRMVSNICLIYLYSQKRKYLKRVIMLLALAQLAWVKDVAILLIENFVDLIAKLSKHKGTKLG